MNKDNEERSPYFYRFEDQRYSVSDEDGDHAYTSYAVECLVFPVIKYTKCGAWISYAYRHYPSLPSTERDWSGLHLSGKRFVNLEANKKFALPTIEEAVISYRARKTRQRLIYEARIRGVTEHLEALHAFLYRYKLVGLSGQPK